MRRQEADGSWGGIQPPWVYSLIALHLGGYGLDHPVMRRGIEGIEGFMVEDSEDSHGVGAPQDPSRRLEACQSPVWDTALAMVALSDAGLAGDHPAMVRAGEWLLGEEVTVPGDWSVMRPGLAPGGWAFEFANVNYPDVDDTAEVVLALERAEVGTIGARRRAARERALAWVEGMQSSDGGWGAFDADNTRSLVRELPFLDFGEVIDEPSADVTAHAVEMLGALGLGGSPAAQAGVRWLIENQERDGSWYGRWGVNHIYGTGAAVPGLVAAGADPASEPIRRAVAWLERHQNEDGGWGRTPALTTIRVGSVGAPAPPPRRPGRCSLCMRRVSTAQRWRAGWRGLPPPSARMGAGTSLSTRALASRPTTTSTTTSTGCPFRSWPWAAALRAFRTSSRRASRAGCQRARGDAPARRAVPRPHRGVGDGQGGGENFPVASRVLPREVRDHLLAVYGFARLVDELGDCAPGDRLAALDWLSEELERAYEGSATILCWSA